VVDEIIVPMPRPRVIDDIVRPEYGSLRSELLGSLRAAGALA
jgi:hypothetical protein